MTLPISLCYSSVVNKHQLLAPSVLCLYEELTTETSSTTLDLFLTNNTTLVIQVHVISCISDNKAVFIESSLRPMKNTPASRKIFQYRKADYEGFKRELHDFTPDFLQKATYPESDIYSLWTDFKCKIHELMKKHIPQKLIRGTKTRKPWIDKQMKPLYRKLNRLFKKRKSSHRPKDVSNYKQMRARVQKAERQAYLRHIGNLIEIGDPEKDLNPGKQKRFWSFIKYLRKDNCGVAPLKENGKMHTDPNDLEQTI